MRKQVKDLIAKRELGLPKSEFVGILRIAEESKEVISLGPGEPDFTTPKNIREATKRALDKGLTHYAPTEGIKELREEIARKLKQENKIDVDPKKQIIVTNGSTESLLLASIVLVEPNDRILIPNPGFLHYIPLTELMSGISVPLKLTQENNFEYQIEEIKKNITEKTHVLVINSPANPTGTVLKKKNLEEIADVIIDHELVIFSDEAYEKFIYGNLKHLSIGSLNGLEDHVITFNTFSKTYAMPGFRIGYAAGPEDLINAMVKTHIYTTTCTAVFLQHGALEALRGPQKEVERMKREYERRGKMMHRRICEIGFTCNKPEGAFYLFPSIKNFGMNSIEFSHMLLKKAKVLVVPGTEFGKYGEGFVRLSYATSYEKIQEAMDRIDSAVRKL